MRINPCNTKNCICERYRKRGRGGGGRERDWRTRVTEGWRRSIDWTRNGYVQRKSYRFNSGDVTATWQQPHWRGLQTGLLANVVATRTTVNHGIFTRTAYKTSSKRHTINIWNYHQNVQFEQKKKKNSTCMKKHSPLTNYMQVCMLARQLHKSWQRLTTPPTTRTTKYRQKTLPLGNFALFFFFFSSLVFAWSERNNFTHQFVLQKKLGEGPEGGGGRRKIFWQKKCRLEKCSVTSR